MLRCILVVFALLAVLVGNDLSLSKVRAQQLELKQSQSTAGAPARVEDQRGTEQSPIVVKVVPAPKTDAEREEEAKARENIEKSERQKEKSDADLANYTSKLAFFTQGLFWATCALVLATIVLGVVALFQSRDMRRSTSAAHGLARRQGQRVVFARDLLATLRRRELEETATRLSAEMGLAYQPAAPRATALRACIGRGSPCRSGRWRGRIVSAGDHAGASQSDFKRILCSLEAQDGDERWLRAYPCRRDERPRRPRRDQDSR
jgi:hypothetical protein